MKRQIIGLVVLGVLLGVFFTRVFDFGMSVSRKMKALEWVMQGYNEEIIYQHMGSQKAEMRLVISKK